MTLDTKKMKKTEMKVTFNYLEPKTTQEAEAAQRRLDSAFDVLFDETERRMAAESTKNPE